MPRTIAIGDIHGCAIALAELLNTIAPLPDDTVVPLGDYVDRGIDSRGVIDQLIALAGRCRLIPILGNHEEMMLGAREGRSDFRFWMNCGGIACLDSYGVTGRMDLIPREHFALLQSCRTYLSRPISLIPFLFLPRGERRPRLVRCEAHVPRYSRLRSIKRRRL